MGEEAVENNESPKLRATTRRNGTITLYNLYAFFCYCCRFSGKWLSMATHRSKTFYFTQCVVSTSIKPK